MSFNGSLIYLMCCQLGCAPTRWLADLFFQWDLFVGKLFFVKLINLLPCRWRWFWPPATQRDLDHRRGCSSWKQPCWLESDWRWRALSPSASLKSPHWKTNPDPGGEDDEDLEEEDVSRHLHPLPYPGRANNFARIQTRQQCFRW